MKEVGKYLLIFIILLVVLLSLLLCSCLFPSSLIKKNVKKSSETLSIEGNRKICFILNTFILQEFDNYSDSLMINTAYSIDNKTPLYSAFTAKKNYIPGITKSIFEDTVGILKFSSRYKQHDEVSELRDTVNGVENESFEYAKYWHGYLIFLRPLLIFFDYQQIRIILTCIFALLAIILTNLITEKKNKTVASIFLLSLFNIEYFYIGLSLINSIMFLIMMISSIILVQKFNKIIDFGLYFFVIGIITGFFGLLDAPLLTLGGPLILYFLLKERGGNNDFKELIKFSILWLLGYALIWFSKWALMDIIYERNLIETGIGQVLYRSSGGLKFKLLAISCNIEMIAIPILTDAFIIYYYLYMKYSKNINKENIKKGKIFFIISLMPIIWYIMLPNHSLNHYFFTYRLLYMSIFSLPLGFYYLYGEPEK